MPSHARDSWSLGGQARLRKNVASSIGDDIPAVTNSFEYRSGNEPSSRFVPGLGVLVPLIGWYFPRAMVRGLMRAVISVRLPANAVLTPWWDPGPIPDPAVWRFKHGDNEGLSARKG